MDRLSPLDAQFVEAEDEDPRVSMAIASIAVFQGPAPSHQDFLAHIERRLPLVPRYRQKLRAIPLRIGRPVWVDDPKFDIRRHIHRIALPKPGGDTELADLMAWVMGQRLDRGHADEGGDVRIGNVELISMRFEVVANKAESFALDRFDVFEPSGTRYLFDKDAMQLWIDPVGVKHDRNELACRDLDWARRCLDQCVADQLQHFVHVTVDNGRHQRLLAGEILVERTDADAGHGCDFVGTGPVIAFLRQNASGRFQERIDG